MSQFPRYESYKDSGVQWLGEIPSHWQAKRLRFCIDTNPLKSEVVLPPDTVVSFVPMENVDVNGVMTLEHERILEDVYKGYTYFKELDVVIAKITPCFENGKSAIAENLVSGVGFGTTEFHVLRSKDNYSVKFLYYLVRSSVFMKLGESEMYGAGGQKRVPELFIKNFISVVPPVLEQRKISRFLDKQLAKIDALIAKQETLLKKLEEQRIALISQAVTKGLDPNVEMKDSGIEWLGEVPKHWDIWKITHAIDSVGSGTTPKSDNPLYYDGEHLWVTTSELRESLINDTKYKVTDLALKECSALKKYPKNSVAIAMYGATIGRLGILEKSATFNQACCVFSNSEILYYKFLYYWLWMRRPILISLSNGGGQPNLSQDDLKKLQIPLPAINEQLAIVEHIDITDKKIASMQKVVSKSINSLKEYRSTLITQAVTGKIDVRNIDIN